MADWLNRRDQSREEIERHRHDEIGIGKNSAPAFQPAAEQRQTLMPIAIFEALDQARAWSTNSAPRPAPGRRLGAWRSPPPKAAALADVIGQRHAEPVAKRRRDEIDLGEAGAADQPVPADARPADDADRRQQQIGQRREERRTTGKAPLRGVHGPGDIAVSASLIDMAVMIGRMARAGRADGPRHERAAPSVRPQAAACAARALRARDRGARIPARPMSRARSPSGSASCCAPSRSRSTSAPITGCSGRRLPSSPSVGAMIYAESAYRARRAMSASVARLR